MTRTSNKARTTIFDRSEYLAGWDRDQSNTSGDLYAYGVNLYRHEPSNRCYLREWGGAAMRVDCNPVWLTDKQAVDWIARWATDGVTGYGYTRAQARSIIAGMEPGKGYRGRDDDDETIDHETGDHPINDYR